MAVGQRHRQQWDRPTDWLTEIEFPPSTFAFSPLRDTRYKCPPHHRKFEKYPLNSYCNPEETCCGISIQLGEFCSENSAWSWWGQAGAFVIRRDECNEIGDVECRDCEVKRLWRGAEESALVSMCTMVSTTQLSDLTALLHNPSTSPTRCLPTSSSLYIGLHCTSTSRRQVESSRLAPSASSRRTLDLSLPFQRTARLPERQRRVVVSSSGAAEEIETEKPIELPIFPLPLVLFPGAILPLQIFEFRYRIMMHTLLQTDLRFGVVFTDKGVGVAAVGCVGEIVKHERLVDDRFFMICKGQERFRVVNMVRTKPYLVAEVEWLEDRPSEEPEDVEVLASEVEAYMKDVIRLSNRVSGKADKDVPDDLRKSLFPTPFSFWVGSTFEGAPAEQQALLELEDTAVRLKREKETLKNTLNYLTAASAVKDAFPSTE